MSITLHAASKSVSTFAATPYYGVVQNEHTKYRREPQLLLTCPLRNKSLAISSAMKIDSTTRFLNQRRKNPDYVRSLVEPSNTPVNRTPVPRLCFSAFSEPLPFSYEGYAKTITDSSLEDHAFFLDTCFVKKEVPQDFWDALSQRTICITDWIDFELSEWKAAPRLNKGFHAAYMNAHQNGDSQFQFLPKPDSGLPLDVAIRHYAGLLGLRKSAFSRIRDDLTKRNGTPPSDDEVKSRVQKLVKERGMLIASKGEKDAAKPNFLADEYLVVQAFAYALTTGRDVTVLTRDRDLSEQFYKTQYLLDTHYRSMLLADSVVEQPLNFLKAKYDDPEFALPGYESMTLYQMPAGMEHRVLPDDYHFVNVHVDRIVESGNDLGYLSMRFCAETEMARVLTTKGETNGLSTKVLDGQNLHRSVHPAMQEQMGIYMAVTRDRFIEAGENRWPEIDVEFAMTPYERGAAIKAHEVPADPPSRDAMRQAVQISNFRLPNRLTPTFALDYERTSRQAVSLALEMMEPWTRFLVSSELIPELPKCVRTALATHDCHVLPAFEQCATDYGLDASATNELSADDGRRVFDYYVALLAHRKMFGRICADRLRNTRNPNPTRKQIRSSLVSQCDPGCWLRARDYLDRPDDPTYSMMRNLSSMRFSRPSVTDVRRSC